MVSGSRVACCYLPIFFPTFRHEISRGNMTRYETQTGKASSSLMESMGCDDTTRDLSLTVTLSAKNKRRLLFNR